MWKGFNGRFSSFVKKERKNLVSILLGEIFLASLWISLHGCRVIFRVPVGRANFSVFVGELESLNQSKGFINRSADWQIVLGDLSNNLFVVNDEQSSQRTSFRVNIDIISLRDFLFWISDQRVVDGSDSSFGSFGVDPRKMDKLGVTREGQKFAVDLLELFISITESNDFSWANKGEIKRIAEKDNIFSFVIAQGDRFEFSVDNSFSSELRGSTLNSSNVLRGHFFFLVKNLM